MDLTSEGPGRDTQGRGRRRNKHYDENEEDSELDLAQHCNKKLEPAKNTLSTVRYEVYWTEVCDKQASATHKVVVDIDSHLLVADVVRIVLNELVSMLAKPTIDRFGMRGQVENWEMRFATREGFPRYDYPGRFGSPSAGPKPVPEQSRELQPSFYCWSRRL